MPNVFTYPQTTVSSSPPRKSRNPELPPEEKKTRFLLRPRRPEESASCLNIHAPVLIKAEQKQPANDCKVSDYGLSRFWGAPGGSASGGPALRGSALAGSALTRPRFSHAQRKSSSARKRLLQQRRVQGHAHSEDLLLRDTFQVSAHVCVCVCTCPWKDL